MAGRRDFVLRGAGVVAVAGVLAGGGTYVIGGGGANQANLWVDTDGGTCTRQGSVADYNNGAACANPVEAWLAASSGDIIRVKAKSGGYNMPTTPNQGHFTGDKAADTKIVGDEAGVIINTGNTAGEFEVEGNHLWLENVVLDSGTVHGWSARIGAPTGQGDNPTDDVTFQDVNVKGSYFGLEITGDRFTWDDGAFGEEGVAALRCNDNGDTEPIQENGGSGHHYSDLVIWPQGGQDNPPCSGDGFHEEDIRVESDNSTYERIVFKDGTNVNRNGGSGKMFLSGTTTGVVIRNVIFGPIHTASNNAIGGNTTSCTLTIAYSTFTDKGTSFGGPGPCSVTSIQLLGPGAPGVPNSGILSAGNAAIDAAAATCAADTGGVDFEGTVRPQGSACDKGADEYTP